MSDLQPDRPWEKKPDQPAGDAAESTGSTIRSWLPVAALVVLGVYGLSQCGASDGSSSDDGPASYEAVAACEEFVERRLKAPSTAEFDTDATGSGNLWTVTGTVHSENGFGGTVRNTFTCDVRYSGGEWVLEDLSGLTN